MYLEVSTLNSAYNYARELSHDSCTMALAYLLLVGFCLLQWSYVNTFTPVIHDAKIPASSQCDKSDPFEDDQELMEKLRIIHQQLPPPGCNSPPTCMDVLRCNLSASSGFYQIHAANGSVVQAYCDMEGKNCGGQGGWTRVIHLNMTNPSSQCAAGFRVDSTSNARFCIRDTSSAGCRSITAESFGLTYSRVCGQVRGYAISGTDGFARFFPNDASLSGNYVDGVSITYGSSPTISHIWTYAAGLREVDNSPYNGNNCPCNTNGVTNVIPAFVGNDYYCESSNLQNTDDPLWDGMQCRELEVPCCNHTGLPWFQKTLSTSTTATITTRVCLDEDTNNENLGIEHLELYMFDKICLWHVISMKLSTCIKCFSSRYICRLQ